MFATSDRQSVEGSGGGKDYRLSKQRLISGILCTVVFSGMAVASFTIGLMDADSSFARPLSAATCVGASYSCFALLGVWLIVSCYRERLRISGDAVLAIGCFRRRVLQLSSISQVVWRVSPAGGSVVLHGENKRIVVYFVNYDPTSRRELIAFFRQALPEGIQKQWPRFESRLHPDPASVRRQMRLVFILIGIAIVAMLLAVLLPAIRDYVGVEGRN